jgi:hypothetical protein
MLGHIHTVCCDPSVCKVFHDSLTAEKIKVSYKFVESYINKLKVNQQIPVSDAGHHWLHDNYFLSCINDNRNLKVYTVAVFL